MATGKKNREIQGLTQVRNVRRDSIVNGEITALKLNEDVAGNGIRLNPITNALELTGEVVVETSSGLISAINSGETNIFLSNGNYTINDGLLVDNDTLHLRGESKGGVIISLPTSGSLLVDHVSGLVLSGSAELNSSNPGVVTISDGNVSGNAPLLAWQDSHLIIDNIPYKVNRVSSGEVSGVAQLELLDPWTGDSFSGKDFKLSYLIENFTLRDLTVVSASSSGVISINRAKNASLSNVAVKGANVLNRVTSGIKLNHVYLGYFNAVEIWNTKYTNASTRDTFNIELDNVHYTSFENLNLYNSDSNGIKIADSSFVSMNSMKLSNINGAGLSIYDSNNIEFANNNIEVNRGSKISNSNGIYFNNNYINTEIADTALTIYNSDADIFINSNLFNGVSGYNGIALNNSKAIINLNNINNASTAIQANSGSIAITGNNIIDYSTNGIVYDSSITDSTLDNNTITSSSTAINVTGTGNYISNNTVISGSASINSGNVFSVLTTIEPVFSGVIDIGLESNPFQDLYLTGNIKTAQDIDLAGNINFLTSGTAINMNNGSISSVNSISLNSGGITGINFLEMSGLIVSAPEAGKLIVGGLEVTGAGGSTPAELSGVPTYLHTQSIPASTWNINHNAEQEDFVINTYDASGNLYIPTDVTIIDGNNVQVINSTPKAGKAVLVFRGLISGAITTVETASIGQYIHTQSVASSTWNINHDLETDIYVVQTYDASGNLFIPNSVTTVDANNITIDTGPSKAGRAIVLSKPGNIVPQGQLVHLQSSPSTTWSLAHNFNSTNFVINTFDESGNVFIPLDIQAINSGLIEITHLTPKAGKAVAIFDHAQIIKLEASGSIYTHTQSVSASTWTINHGQNQTNYSITTFDSAGSVTNPTAINTIDANTIEVVNAAPTTGSATIVFAGTVLESNQTQYIHTQNTPNTTWNVAHNFGDVNFNIDVYNTSGELFLPLSIKPIDQNNIEITHSTPKAGKAVIIFQNANVDNVSEKITATGQAVVQEVIVYQSGSLDLGTGASTVIPLDNTVPQISEGVEFLSGVITPNYTDSIIDIDIQAYVGVSVASRVIGALYKDNESSALSASHGYNNLSGTVAPLSMKHRLTTGNTSPITLTVRAGKPSSSDSLYVNSPVAGPNFGDVVSSVMIIKELREF